MITLNFHPPILYSAASTAALLQCLSQFLQFFTSQRNTRHHRDCLAAAAVDLALDAHDAVPGRRRLLLAPALSRRLRTARA